MSTTEHPYAHILRAIADGKAIQLRNNVDQTWLTVDNDVVLKLIGSGEYEQQGIRVKPLTINGIDVAEPCRMAPDFGSKYWIASISNSDFVRGCTWSNDNLDKHWLKRGLVHLTREAAAAHAKALLSFTEPK